MLRLIPAPLHRLALRIAHNIRTRLRRIFRPDLAGVAVLLRDREERLLLVRHSYGPSGWAIPGGGLGKGEDAAEAARREIREELSCELDELKVLAVYEEILTGRMHTAHVFSAAPTSEPRVDGRELLEARWFHMHELPELCLTRITQRRLEELRFYSSES